MNINENIPAKMLHARPLRRDYTGSVSLKTTDHCVKKSLLSEYTAEGPPKVKPELTIFENEQFLLELSGVLSAKECAEIIKNADKCMFENMSEKYRFGKQRDGSRLLALDKSLAESLWPSIHGVLFNEIVDKGVSTQPLGFDVTRGVWDLHGLNEAMRINKYSGKTKGFFGPHKDAQFCPNGDERSIMTLLIYLNEDFKGGETCFYFPKDSTLSSKDLTVKEEIELHGGLKKGYECVKIVPKVGHAVLSSQSILHEALPVRNGTKYILKTDVVVKRSLKEFGFAIEEWEKKDYLTCLDYFRSAQQKELDKNFDVASDLFEKALSIRYSYPGGIYQTPKKINTSGYKRLPLEVWFHVFRFLSGHDAQNLVYAYPELNFVMARFEQRRRNKAPKLTDAPYIPKLRFRKGIVSSFVFPDAHFFYENKKECCRVAALYSFFLLSHSPHDSVYTVRYNPDTQEVCVVALETFLTDVFYGQRCYGSVYNVRQQDSKTKDPKKDFETSVDRNHMLMRHGAEFTGVELPDSFYTKSTVYDTGEDEDNDGGGGDDDDDDDDDSDDDCCGDNYHVKNGRDDNGDDDDDECDDDDSDDKDCHNDNYPVKNGHDDNGDDDDNDDRHDDDHSDNHDNDADHDNDHDDVGNDDSGNGDNERGGRKNGVYHDNIFPFYYDIDESFPMENVLRDMLIWADRIKSMHLDEEIDEDILNDLEGSDQYFEAIGKRMNGSSAALVSRLKTPLSFERHQVCVCFMGPNADSCNKLDIDCSTEYFNHLVFDFEQSQLNVKFHDGYFVEDIGQEEYATESYEQAVLRDMASFGCMGELIRAEVNIEPVLSSDTAFDHASCRCGHPRFEVEEHYNLKRYPHLTSISLYAKEKDGKMAVWTVYNGIVAL